MSDNYFTIDKESFKLTDERTGNLIGVVKISIRSCSENFEDEASQLTMYASTVLLSEKEEKYFLYSDAMNKRFRNAALEAATCVGLMPTNRTAEKDKYCSPELKSQKINYLFIDEITHLAVHVPLTWHVRYKEGSNKYSVVPTCV